MKRFLFGLTLLMLSTLSLWAARAIPFPITLAQPDGTTVTVRLHGDEHFSYYTTLDGILVVRNSDGIYVANVNADGTIAASPLLAHNANERSEQEIALARKQNKEAFYENMKAILERTAVPQTRVVDSPSYYARLFPHVGKPKVLVFLADFADTKFTIGEPIKNFDQYLNNKEYGTNAMKLFPDSEGVTHHEDRNYCSVAKYFDFCSDGKFVPQFDIFPEIIHLTQNRAYYGGSANNGKDDKVTTFISDVCKAAYETYSIDFSPYDSNGDGDCDLIYVIFAGYGENNGADNDCIWAKSGSGSFGTYNGITIRRYGVSCELAYSPDVDFGDDNLPRIDGIGIFCHEFSHTMGLPDFYYTTLNGTINNQGMEAWSVMDFGGYLYINNAKLFSPLPYNAWERNDMGWFDGIETVTEDGVYTLNSMGKSNKNALKIVNPKNSNEFLILENIQSTDDFYKTAWGQGLLVTHVNYESSYFSTTSNSVNNVKGRPRMTLIPADGELTSTYNDKVNLKKTAQGDLYPGTSKVTQLSSDSKKPNFDWFTNVDNGTVYTDSPIYPNFVKLSDIKEENGVITLNITLDINATGISNANSEARSQKVYNLNGQQVGNGYKGITIKNGRKIFAPVL